MQISIAFDPKKDAAADVQAALLRFYATVNGTQLADAAVSGTTATEDDDTNAAALDPKQLDKTGIPHDPRIHSEKPTQTAAGVWRKRKGVDDITFKTISEQLRTQYAGASTATQVTQQLTPPAGTPALGLPALNLPAQQPDEYTKLVTLISSNMNTPQNPAGQINDAWLQGALKQCGVASGMLNDLQNADPALVKQIRVAIAGALGQAVTD